MNEADESEGSGADVASERFRHLTFLGELPESPLRPPARRLRSEASRRRRPPPPELPPDTSEFFITLCDSWGLTASRYRDSIFHRRESACLRALQASSPIEGMVRIGRDPAASERALGAVMIGVTEFFRDPDVFLSLQDRLPGLSRPSHPFRALSVGCSNGAEVYSLAILLAEAGLIARADLHGIDCRPAAIATAREGVYSLEAVESIPAEWRIRHLEASSPRRIHGDHRAGPRRCVRIREPLRSACRWEVADAFGPAPTTPTENGRYDLVMCRNLSIYLTPEASVELWERCVSRLRPGGLLVVGKAERPPAGLDSLRLVDRCIYRRAEER